MPSEQTIDILMKALDIWQAAGENPTERQYLDTISLISLAIKKEPEPIPFAHSMQAQIHFDVDNYDAAWDAAENTLSLDPYDYKAQLIKVYIAFAYTVEAMEDIENQGGIFSTVGGLFRSRGGYQAGHQLGSAIANRSNAKNLKKIFNVEFLNLIKIYDHMANNGYAASDFTDFSNKLIKLADGIYESPRVLEDEINIFALVAESPIDNLDFETDDEREQLETIQLIAEGRMA